MTWLLPLSVLLHAALAGSFPFHMPRERVGYNTTYSGRCLSGGKPVLTFLVTVSKHSINIMKGTYENTSHFGVELANPPGSSTTAETGTSSNYKIVGFTTTAFGGNAAAFQYRGSNQTFSCTSTPNPNCLMDYNFVKDEFSANSVPWSSSVTAKVQRHWPRHNNKPYGPPPAERLMVTIQLANSALTATQSPSNLQSTLQSNYGKIVSSISVVPSAPANITSPLCVFTVPMDYDIGWTAWPLALTVTIGVLVTVAVSVFKCCPCASVKRLYHRKSMGAAIHIDSLTADPTSGPSEVDMSEGTIKLDKE